MMTTPNKEVDSAAEEKSFLLLPSLDTDATFAAVDLAVLKGFEDAQLEGEPDLIVELIDLYLTDAFEKLTTMRQAFASVDERSLKRAAHSLLGSSANLGAHRMAALCEEIERSGGDELFQSSEMLMARLEQESESVRRIFSAERRRRS